MAEDDDQRTPLPFIWSQIMHETFASEQLSFWRLSFAPSYDRESVLQVLGRLFGPTFFDVSSFAIYEVFGVWDLLVRLWLPNGLRQEDLDSALHKELRPLTLDASEYMIVTNTARHWLWGGSAPLEPPQESPSGEAIKFVENRTANYLHGVDERYDITGGDSDNAVVVGSDAISTEIADLEADGFLRVFDPDQHGVKFYIEWGIPIRTIRAREKEVLLRRISEQCRIILANYVDEERFPSPPQISVYSGSGTMTNFLILAKAPDGHFYSFARDLIFSLVAATDMAALYGSRPYTHVIAHRSFIAFRDTLPAPTADTGALGDRVLDLIDRDEDEQLEFKASVQADVRGFFATGKWREFDFGPLQVVKAVCGLLNAPNGGVLILGVQEYDRISDRVPNFKERLGEFPLSPMETKIIVGMEPDVKVIGRKLDWDGYRLRIAELIAAKIRPVASPYLKISRVEMSQRTLTVIEVRASPSDWFYADIDKAERFFARELGRTIEYRGPDISRYQAAHPRSRWRDEMQ